jgi:hypothetical protein
LKIHEEEREREREEAHLAYAATRGGAKGGVSHGCLERGCVVGGARLPGEGPPPGSGAAR